MLNNMQLNCVLHVMMQQLTKVKGKDFWMYSCSTEQFHAFKWTDKKASRQLWVMWLFSLLVENGKVQLMTVVFTGRQRNHKTNTVSQHYWVYLISKRTTRRKPIAYTLRRGSLVCVSKEKSRHSSSVYSDNATANVVGRRVMEYYLPR